jgi:HEPN/Toprim N-terminal domain 1
MVPCSSRGTARGAVRRRRTTNTAQRIRKSTWRFARNPSSGHWLGFSLDLMGWTLDAARAEYNALLGEQIEIAGEVGTDMSDALTFDEFCALVCRYPLASLDDTYIERDDERDSIVRARFLADQAEMDRLPMSYDSLYWSEKKSLRFENLRSQRIFHAASFRASESNRDVEVVWQYGTLVDAGWASVSEFLRAGAGRRRFNCDRRDH